MGGPGSKENKRRGRGVDMGEPEFKRISTGGEEWVWVNRINPESPISRGERSGYGWTRSRENKGGGRGVDMGL